MNSNIIQSILFLKGRDGINLKDLSKILQISPKKTINEIDVLNQKLLKENSPFVVKEFENIYWLSLNSELSFELAKKMRREVQIRLTKPLVEILTIIAYNQPVTKSYIEKIRGVNVDYGVFKLLNYDLIEEVGRDSNRPGNPRLFKTTPYFLILFNMKTLSELPPLEREFKEKTEEIQLFNYDGIN